MKADQQIINASKQFFPDPERKDFMADRQVTRIAQDAFCYGAQWERHRDKWHYLPEKPEYNKNLNALTSKGRVVLSFIDASGEFDLNECDQYLDEKGEYEHIIAWQYHPKPPKK